MSALHRSPVIMDESGIETAVKGDLVVLPEQAVAPAATIRRLAAFVRQGGKLLTTGASLQSPELRKWLGVKAVRFGEVKDGHVLLKHGDEPTGVDSAWDRMTLADGAEELYPLYLSWDQFNPELRSLANNWPMHGQVDEEKPQPAGFPAAVARRLGRGCLVHVATDIFAQYRVLGDPQMLRWLRELVDYLQPAPFFETDAPSWVDVSLRRKGGDLLAHFVNTNPGRDLSRLNTDDVWVDEIPRVGPFAVRIRCSRKPGSVRWEPAGMAAEWKWRNGVLNVALPELHIHACLVVSGIR